MIPILTVVGMAITVSVCGSTGGLGRELCQQALEQNIDTVALVRTAGAEIRVPNRDAWFEDRSSRQPLISHPRLSTMHHDDLVRTGLRYNALVLALGGKPFKEDTTTEVVRLLCQNVPPSCNRVCLVSAFGVEDPDASLQWMTSWYLRGVYRAKAAQEDIVRALSSRGIDVLITRPRALCYGPTPVPLATPREQLARDILTWCQTGVCPRDLLEISG